MAEVPGSDDSANRIDNSDHTDSSLSSDSIFHMEAGELYPKCDTVRDQESVSLPLKPLCGEDVKFLGQVNGGIVALSNYRFFYRSFSKDICNIISIGAIEQVEVEGLTVIKISCKDVQTFRCNFSTPESCLEWYKRLTSAIIVPKNLDEIFAFAHYAWAGEDLGDDLPPYVNEKADQNMEIESFKSEVDRMNFNVSNEGAWRISEANMEFELCKTYPPYLLVPASVSDDDLAEVAKFRSSRRVPIAVWRHHTNGAIIARCSQPEVGLFGCRSAFDEQLLQAFIDACAPSCSPELRKKLLIIDARSYSTAVTNRVRGGGCECPEYYLHCDIKFMNLPNIHAVRRSFNALQALCAMPADEASWLTGLDATRWLHYISGLLSAAVTVFSAVECNCQPVVVHCSDGWDRTPQIVSLAQILLDPYYRTVKGFQVLVEREWLAFGHKFSSRCGLTEELDERSPVFLQWLDCIQNIHKQYPCSFEFSLSFLMKLAQHIYSNLFGTFLCNSIAERKKLSVPERTFSVWKFLEQPEYRNHLYTPNGDQILFPAYNVRDLQVWRELYLGYSNGESFFAVATGLAKLDEATSIFDADNKSDKPKNDSDSLKVSALKISEAVSAWMESGVASFDSVKRDETNHGSIQSSTETLVSTDNLRETVIEEAPAESTETESENHRKTEGGNMLTYLFGGLRANSTPENPQITVTEIKDCDKVCKCIDPIDGLSSFRDDVQERLVRLTHENKEREVALEQELYNSRVDFIVEALAGRSVVGDYELFFPVNAEERAEFQGEPSGRPFGEEEFRRVLSNYCAYDNSQVENDTEPTDGNEAAEFISVQVEQEATNDDSSNQGSLCSTEVSWEALEEPVQTLWVPDHAVSHCTNCHNKFWLGRRNTTAGNVVRYFAQSVQNTLFRYQIKNFFNQ